ncbi:MAG: MBL fold metallo-hydrolase [Nanoarchaeota archaeon]
MMRAKKLSNDVWELSGGLQPSSNVYYIKSMQLLIDLASEKNKADLLQQLEFINVKVEDIKIIILTHFHFDHIGNSKLFKHAKFYASEDEIISYRFAPRKTTGSTGKEIEGINIKKIPERIGILKIIKTPGHTRGSICILKEDDKILFTGDTLFRNGAVGCTKLPTSVPKKMEESLKTLLAIPHNELGPGHNLEDGLILQQHH